MMRINMKDRVYRGIVEENIGVIWLLVPTKDLKQLHLELYISDTSLINLNKKLIYLSQQDAIIYIDKFIYIFGFTPYIEELYVPVLNKKGLDLYDKNLMSGIINDVNLNVYIVKEKEKPEYILKTTSNIATELEQDDMVEYVNLIDSDKVA